MNLEHIAPESLSTSAGEPVTPAEMQKCALAEIGLGHLEVWDQPRPDSPYATRWRCVSQEATAAARKAATLVLLRLGGPNYPMVCVRHKAADGYVRCQRVTVAEVLLDLTVTCGAP